MGCSCLHPKRLGLPVLVAVVLTLGGPAAATEIWEIQGSGTESPLVGQVVTTGPNIVTALTNLGFFMQTPPERSDGDPATSDGIYVYLGERPDFSEGDTVEVSATVAEYYGMTELSGATAVTVTDHGARIPDPVNLGPDLPSPDDPPPEHSLERLEGMLVRIPSGVITGPLQGRTRFRVVARASRAFREPGIPYPGRAGLPVWDGNPEILDIDMSHRGDTIESPDGRLAAGAPIHDLSGPLAYNWGRYQVWIHGGGYVIDGPFAARSVRPRHSGEIAVATQNVQRLLDSVDDPGVEDVAVPQEIVDERLAKLSLWIRQVLRSPTIVALQEVENIGILQALADTIHADGGPRYVPYLLEGNDISGIDVGYLVDETFAVDDLQQLQADERFSYEANDFTLWDRPPLLLRGRFTGNGAPFPLVLLDVHLRSMNGIDGDNAGFVREKRHRQAVRLSQAIQELQETEAGLHLVVLGDFNAFQFTDGWVDVMGQITGRPDPLGALIPATDEVDPDLDDQVLTVPGTQRYSFIHEGSAEVLDHILSTDNLKPWVRGTQFAHGNADAPDIFTDVSGRPERCSDHDGLVLYLMTDGNGNGVPDDREPRTPRRVRVRVRATGPTGTTTRALSRP